MLLVLLKLDLRKKSFNFSFLAAIALNVLIYFEIPRILMIWLYLRTASSLSLSLLHALIATPLLTCYYSGLLMLGKGKWASLSIFFLFLAINRISMIVNKSDSYYSELPLPLVYLLLLLFPPILSQRVIGVLLRTDLYSDSSKL